MENTPWKGRGPLAEKDSCSCGHALQKMEVKATVDVYTGISSAWKIIVAVTDLSRNAVRGMTSP